MHNKAKDQNFGPYLLLNQSITYIDILQRGSYKSEDCTFDISDQNSEIFCVLEASKDLFFFQIHRQYCNVLGWSVNDSLNDEKAYDNIQITSSNNSFQWRANDG